MTPLRRWFAYFNPIAQLFPSSRTVHLFLVFFALLMLTKVSKFVPKAWMQFTKAMVRSTNKVNNQKKAEKISKTKTTQKNDYTGNSIMDYKKKRLLLSDKFCFGTKGYEFKPTRTPILRTSQGYAPYPFINLGYNDLKEFVYQHICASDNFKDKSPEELRFEDMHCDTFKSIALSNHHDQCQFIVVYAIIGDSQIVQSMDVPDEIVIILANFSTGSTYNCSNESCGNVICTLFEDKQNVVKEPSKFIDAFQKQLTVFEATNRDSYAHSLLSVEQYFCFECMDNLTRMTCVRNLENCGNKFMCAPEYHVCGICEGICYNCPCYLETEICSSCNNKMCYLCLSEQCIKCKKLFCKECHHLNGVMWTSVEGLNQFVCNECYIRDTVLCSECNVEFHVLYEGNKVFQSTNALMFVCEHEGCSKYIHAGCNMKNANTCPLALDIKFMLNGKNQYEDNTVYNMKKMNESIFSTKFQKRGCLMYRCKEHQRNEDPVHFYDYVYEEQRKIEYEEALYFFLKALQDKNLIIQLYDFEYRGWRKVRYHDHFDIAKKIIVRLDCASHGGEIQKTLSFPCNHLRVLQ